jgi:cobyrinic acid a,c-diamide synthase
MGAVMHNAAMTLPERHLGLTVASEVVDAMQRLDAAADALASTPLGRMTLDDLQRWSVDFVAPLSVTQSATRDAGQSVLTASGLPLHGKTIAIARDAAFCFIYAANLDCLRQLGAELVFFSPLLDGALPSCDAVWIPGGYPELHAQTLSDNVALRASLAAHIAAAKPVWAECGGMMVLFESLLQVDGQRVALWGLLPGEVAMHKRLAALGPQQLSLHSGVLRGHTFHYSTTTTALEPIARTSRPAVLPTLGEGEALWLLGPVRASYFHAWFPSCPAAVVELFTVPTAGVIA